MTSPFSHQPITLDSVLFLEKDTLASLKERLANRAVIDSEAPEIGRLSPAARRALINKVAEASMSIFDLDLLDVIAHGWTKHSALVAAAERSLASPNDSEIVQLATHRITWVHRPAVDLLINDLAVGTVHFEVSIELLVQALLASIQRGRITALHSGICDVTAKLLVASIEICSGHVQIELPISLHLDEGIPLLERAGHPTE